MRPFEGMQALVTGAAGGLGRAISGMLAAEGARVALSGRTEESVREVAGSLAGWTGDGGPCYACDFASDDLHRFAERLAGDLDRLDILIHCAGAHVLGSVEATSVEQFDEQYRVNVRAPYLLTRSLLPKLRASHGQVLFMNSTVGLRARAGTTAYSASKHALTALADGLRDEANPDGIRITSIFLGRVATPMQSRVHDLEGKPYHPDRLIQPDDVAELTRAILTLDRTAEVTDVRIRPMVKPG